MGQYDEQLKASRERRLSDNPDLGLYTKKNSDGTYSDTGRGAQVTGQAIKDYQSGAKTAPKSNLESNADSFILKFRERSPYVYFGTQQYDKEAFNLAAEAQRNWWENTGSKGKQYGYDMTDPEDVLRAQEGRYSKKYEASYGDDEYSQWLLANGQASGGYFESKYYKEAYNSVMLNRAEQERVKNFKKAVVQELVATAENSEHPTNDEIAEATLRIQRTNPMFAGIDIVNPKTSDSSYDGYFSPALAEQEAAESNAEKRSNALYLDDVYDAYYAAWDSNERRKTAVADWARSRVDNIISSAITNSGYNADMQRGTGLAYDSQGAKEYEDNYQRKKEAATAAVEQLSNYYDRAQIQAILEQDGRLSYMDSQQKIAADVAEAERKADIDMMGNQILGLTYKNEKGQKVVNVSETPTQQLIKKAQSIANMGTAARAGFSPISMDDNWQAENLLSDNEKVVLNVVMENARSQLASAGFGDFEVDEYFRRADLGEYIPPEQAMRNALIASGMDESDVQNVLDSYTDEDWANAQKVALDLAAIEGVSNSTIDQPGYSIISMPVTAAFKVASSFANFADMVAGDPDWAFVDTLNEKVDRWAEIGHDSNHKVLSTMSEVGSEIFRILAVSKLGAIAGGASAATKGMSWIVSQAGQRIPFIASAMGSYYGEAKAGGASSGEATKYALIAGTVEGILESLAIGDVMQSHLGSKLFSKKVVDGTGVSRQLFAKYGLPLADIIVSSVGEGLEESLSYVASGLARRGSWDNNYKMSWDELGENFMGGLLIGGIMSGLAAPANSQRYKYATEMLEKTGAYTTDFDSLYAASYFETRPQAQRDVLTEKYNNGEIVADKNTRKEAIKAERELDAISREVTAKQQALEAARVDAQTKVEQADKKVADMEQRIATLRETDNTKKAKKIAELTRQLNSARKAQAEVRSEAEKKVKTAESDYTSILDKQTTKAADLEETIANYQAAKYFTDFYGISQKPVQNAPVGGQVAMPITNTTDTANVAQNPIDTVKTETVEVAEPVGAEISPVMDFGAGEVVVDGTVMASEGKFKESRVTSNTLTKKFGEEAVNTFKQIDPDFGSYEVISEESSLNKASKKIEDEGIDNVVTDLISDNRSWSGVDLDAAMMILTQKMADNTDESGLDALLVAEKMNEQGTEGGQLIQSFAKWTRTPAGMAVEAVKQSKKTQDKILKGNASKKKSVEADRKAVKEATKKARVEAADKTAKAVTRKITEEKALDPVQILARKVVKAAQPRNAAEHTFIEKMVSDLFGVATSSPITPVDNRIDNTMAKIGEAYSNIGEYKRVWEEAEKAVIDLMGDSPEVINALNAYRINRGRTIVPEATLKKAYNKAAKAVGLDMSKLIKQRSGDVEAMRNALVNYLITNTGVNEEGAVALAMEANKIFNRENGKATARYLNSMLGEKSVAKQAARTALEDIEGITNAGALVDIAYADVIESKLDPKFRKILRDTGYTIGDVLAYGAGKEDMAMRVLLSDVQRANVSLEDMATLVDMAMNTYREVVAQDKQAYLNRQFAERSQAAPEDALKTVTKLVNAGVLTNQTVADKVESKLDSKFRKTLKDQGVDVKSIILKGDDAVDNAANAFAAQVDNLNISSIDKKQIKDAMYNTFNEVVAEVKDKYAQTLINRYEAKQNPAEKQQPMDNIQKVLYNAAMGVYSDKRIDNAILEANGLPVVTEEDIAYIKANMEKALEARKVMNSEGKDALYEGEKADYQIRRYQEEAAKVIASKMSVDGRVKFRDFQRVMMLLNSKTLIKNTAANVPMGVLENIKDNPAALVDILTSKVTGKRTTQGTTLNKIKAQTEGLKKGVTETIKDYKYGVNTANANMLGRYSAFEDGDVINRTTNAKPRVWNNDTFVGKVLNGADKLLSTGMALGDRPFFEAAAASRAAELEALGYDVNSDESQMDIVRYALDRTFQNNSDAAQAFSNIRNGLNKLHIGDVGLGDLVMPFVQTPGNITDKLIDYSGVGGAARGIAQIIGAKKTGEFDQKLFVDRMGRSMTGFGMMALGYALAKCGALVLGARDDEERQAMNNAGVKEFSITLDGETYHTIDWADPTANLLFIGGAISEMGFEGATMGQIVEASIGTAVNSIFQMSVLQNLATLFSGSEDDVWRNLGGTAENFPTQFVWATINAVARTADPYERETYSPDRLQQMANKVMAKIPGLRERLPIKLNTAGQEIKSYRGDTMGERFLQSFINPGYSSEVSDDVVFAEMWRLRKDGGYDSQYLPKAYKSFDGIQLTAEQYQEYQRILGNATYSAALNTINSDKYKKADDATKADMLDEAISKAMQSKEVKEFKEQIKNNN